MKIVILRVALLAAVAGICLPLGGARASILPGTWVLNTVNTYEDQDRTSIFDLDNSGSLSPGDVFLGYLRIDSRLTPLPGVPIPPAGQSLYAIFGLEVSQFTPGPNPDGRDVVDGIPGNGNDLVDYVVEFDAISNPAALAAGLDLNTITGGQVAANTTQAGVNHSFGDVPAVGKGVMAMVYEDINTDLISSPPPAAGGDSNGDGQFDILDFMDHIANQPGNNLDLVLGKGGAASEADDYWVGQTTSAMGMGNPDVVQNLAVLNLINFPSPVGLSFNAALSALGGSLEGQVIESTPDQQISAPGFFSVVPGGFPGAAPNAIVPPVPPNRWAAFPAPWTIAGGNNHELIISGGNLTGAGNLSFGALGNPYFGSTAGSNINFYGMSSNADFALFPIPEPGSVLIWSLLLAAGMGFFHTRRRK